MKLIVCVFVVLIFIDMILGWMCETNHWRAVAEAFKNL